MIIWRFPRETGKIYVAKDTNLTYRWSGTAYVEISKSLALGETSSTAFRGDYGKALYDFAQTAIAGGLLKTQLDSKLNKTDKYTAPIDLEYDSTNKYWAWDYSHGDNALIEMSGSEPTTDIRDNQRNCRRYWRCNGQRRAVDITVE